MSLPVQSLSIANVLNGETNRLPYGPRNESSVRFTAPDANVLIVDDIDTNLKVANGLLSPYMMKVSLCKSGAEAIKAVKTQRYDLVFMDHRMPEMDGVEATKVIRGMGADDPHIKDMPIIALTANAISGTKEMFLQNGFNDFMSKPIDIVKLNEMLEKWLPREKQKKSSAEKTPHARAGAESTGNEKIIIEIEGVDVKQGIAISGGMEGLYMETLAAFYKDGRDRTGIIRNCLETGNLDLYRTHVHGIKSALFNIGAARLSESAKALEAAVDRDDLDYIQSNNVAFLSDLESLLEQINAYLSKQASVNTAAVAPDMDKFKAGLVRLNEALSIMDRAEINKAIINLYESAPTEEYAAGVKVVANKIVLADYDEAEALVDSLLREVE